MYVELLEFCAASICALKLESIHLWYLSDAS